MSPKVTITPEELRDPRVDEALERDLAIRTMLAKDRRVNPLRRLLLSSLFYTSLVGAAGGALGWALIEPHFDDAPVIGGAIRAVEPDRSPDLPEARLLPKGLLRLEKTDVYLLPGFTQLEENGARRTLEGTAGLEPGDQVRVTGQLIATNAFLARTVEKAPLPGGAELPGEPDLVALETRNGRVGLFWFAVIGGMIALMVGSVEELVSLNFRQALIGGAISLGVGFAGGLVGLLPAGTLYHASSVLVARWAGDGVWFTLDDLHGASLFGQIVGRSLAWGVVGMALALGQGVARKSRKLIVNGLIGGALGGLLGGLLFDPIARISGADEADLSRGVGFITIGLLVGLFTGLVEQLSKEAWLLLRTGPLAGKQFVVHKTETVFGSAPASDIFLYKDPLVAPAHARLRRLGRTYEIEDLNTPHGTRVNGRPVQRCILRDGDAITIGDTRLEYRSRGA